ncbi:MAG: Uma2 family endonuclease [Gammaproteobacteria bacterium]
MAVALNLKPAPAARIDQRVCLHGVTWQDFEALLAMRGDNGAVRVSYLEGELELMAPSIDHENLKTRLARLLEAYAEERGIELEGFGSWTLKAETLKRGAEADECYLVGWREPMPPVPDIVIEVIWTSGGLDKLAIYRGLGVPEVWFWQDGGLCFYLLDEGGYTAGARSTRLPDLDPDLLTRGMAEATTQTAAVRAYRQALRGAAPGGD